MTSYNPTCRKQSFQQHNTAKIGPGDQYWGGTDFGVIDK